MNRATKSLLAALLVACLGVAHHAFSDLVMQNEEKFNRQREKLLSLVSWIPAFILPPDLPFPFLIYFLLMQIGVLLAVLRLLYSSRCRCPLCTPPFRPKYRVERLLGQGAFARVLLASRHDTHQRPSSASSATPSRANTPHSPLSPLSHTNSHSPPAPLRSPGPGLVLLAKAAQGGGVGGIGVGGVHYAIKQARILDITECNDAYVEMELLLRVEHPHLVRIEDQFFHKQRRNWLQFFHTDLYYCIVEEFCSGGDLFDLIDRSHKERGGLSEEECLDMFVQIVEAVDFMHSKAIIHRDLKPDNILVSSSGNLKIADLGLGEKLRSNKVVKGGYAGTEGYIAPEVWLGKPHGKACDVWSLGVVLFTMVCWLDMLTLFRNAGLAKESDNDAIEVVIRSPADAIALLLTKVEAWPRIRSLVEMMLVVNWKQRASCGQLLQSEHLKPFRRSRRRSLFKSRGGGGGGGVGVLGGPEGPAHDALVSQVEGMGGV